MYQRVKWTLLQSFLCLFFLQSAQAAKNQKVEICHFDEDTKSFISISISESAVQKHFDKHGDVIVGTYYFDADGDGFGSASEQTDQCPNSGFVDNDDDIFPDDPNEWFDTDGDGIGDNSDQCPEEAADTLDGCPAVNQPPVIVLEEEYFIGQNKQFVLDPQASDPDGNIASFQWQQNSGTPVLFDPEASQLSFTAPECQARIEASILQKLTNFLFPSAYAQDLSPSNICHTLSFTLIVVDNDGAESTTSFIVKVLKNDNVAPSVTLEASRYTVNELGSVDLTATIFDPDDSILKVEWSQVDDNYRAIMGSRDKEHTSITFPSVDGDTVFSFTVSVSDGGISVNQSIEIQVLENKAWEVLSPQPNVIIEKSNVVTIFGTYSGTDQNAALSVSVEGGSASYNADIDTVNGLWSVDGVELLADQQQQVLRVVGVDELGQSEIKVPINVGTAWQKKKFYPRAFFASTTSFAVSPDGNFAYVVDDDVGVVKTSLSGGARERIVDTELFIDRIEMGANDAFYGRSNRGNPGLYKISVDGAVLNHIDVLARNFVVYGEFVYVLTDDDRVVVYSNDVVIDEYTTDLPYVHIAINPDSNVAYLSNPSADLCCTFVSLDLDSGEISPLNLEDYVPEDVYENDITMARTSKDEIHYSIPENAIYIIRNYSGNFIRVDLDNQTYRVVDISSQAYAIADHQSIPWAAGLFVNSTTGSVYIAPNWRPSIFRYSDTAGFELLSDASRGVDNFRRTFGEYQRIFGKYIGYKPSSRKFALGASNIGGALVDYISGDSAVHFSRCQYFDDAGESCAGIIGRRFYYSNSDELFTSIPGFDSQFGQVDDLYVSRDLGEYHEQYESPLFYGGHAMAFNSDGSQVFVYDADSRQIWIYTPANDTWVFYSQTERDREYYDIEYDAISGNLYGIADTRSGFDRAIQVFEITADNEQLLAKVDTLGGRSLDISYHAGERSLIFSAGWVLYRYNLDSATNSELEIIYNGMAPVGIGQISQVLVSPIIDKTYILVNPRRSGSGGPSQLVEVDNRTGSTQVLYQ